MTARQIAPLLALLIPLNSPAGLQDLLDKLPLPGKSADSNSVSAALTDTEVTAGLKEALDKASAQAVDSLGRSGGFLNNPKVRIPMPEHLAWVEKSLRGVGQDALADEFVGTMNSAAEQAVPLALEQFRNAIQAMTIEDAKGILSGPDDAATQYFRQQSESSLHSQFMPVVSNATQQAGVTASYKAMVDKADFLGGLMNTGGLDLDQYITDKTLDGLFLMVAEEEKQIRENPVARSTELLKKVFGAGTN